MIGMHGVTGIFEFPSVVIQVTNKRNVANNLTAYHLFGEQFTSETLFLLVLQLIFVVLNINLALILPLSSALILVIK
jgi:uncharacterized membrane protein YesL